MKPLIISLVLLGAIAPAHADSSSLYAGQYLFPGQSVEAPSCYYQLRFQSDGNLVLYTTGGWPVWASGTNGSGAGYATMQADGNLVVYRWDGTPVWATGTDGWGGARASVQDDGNFVVYWVSWPIWASDTNGEEIGTTACYGSRITSTDQNMNRYGGDYSGFAISQPMPLWCAYYCAEDYARCNAYTYVPPGVQGPDAMCWLKSSVPGLSYAPGLVSGVIVR